MSKNFHTDVLVNGQLIVGSSPGSTATVGLGAGPTLAAGGAYFAAPFVIGDKIVNTASLADIRIARKNPKASPNAVPPNISILSINNLSGVPPLPTDILIGAVAPCGITINTGIGAGALTVIYGTNTKTQNVAGEFSVNLLKDDLASFAKKIAAKLESGFETRLSAIASLAAKIESGPTNNASSTACPIFFGNLVGNVTGTASGNKKFDIPHVKDPKKRITHICAEGPEAGIYIRGRLTNKNVIELPEYWDGLIDPDSITVTFTQIGYSQDLIVESIDWGKVIRVKSGNGANIDCFYEVWAARWIDPMNHDEKLHVVYEGESPDDYPGNKENFLVGGWDYDRRIPKWGKRSEEEK